MSYRLTKKAEAQRSKLAAMRRGRDLARMDSPAPDYPAELPMLRRQIIIRDFDFGEDIHTIDLYRTNRVDCYRVVADGVEWKRRAGWSQILAGLRKAMPRIGATMPLVRGRHSFDDQFTQIPNAWLRDNRLSLQARGLLAQLMSHAPGWNITQESLAKANNIGRDAMR